MLQGTLEQSRVKTFSPTEIGDPMLNLDAGELRIYNRIREHLKTHKAGKQVDEIYLVWESRHVLGSNDMCVIRGYNNRFWQSLCFDCGIKVEFIII